MAPLCIISYLLLMTMTHNNSHPTQERCSRSQLGRAAGSQSLDTLKKALQGWTVNEIDNNDEEEGTKNPLHMAAWQGCIENVQYLIKHCSCNVNAISTAEFSYGKTPLFFAATQSRNDVVLYLLDNGAVVRIVNNKGQSVRSIAASHLSVDVVQRIVQHEQQEQQPWQNYRDTHSDGLEYGDLDPRFLDRPLRDTDVVTEHAVNPTTKQSRQHSFLRKNPHRAKQLPKVEKTQRNKKRQPRLSLDEQMQLEQSWAFVLERIESVILETNTPCHTELHTNLKIIVNLSDKQQGSWIPEAARRLQNTCDVDSLTSLSFSSSTNKRECILLQKLDAEIRGVRRKGGEKRRIESVTVVSDSHSSSVQFTHELLRERRDELELALGAEHIGQFHQDGHDILDLPEPPLWVDSMNELESLEEALMQFNIAAIDTEWCNGPDGSISVATLQVAIPGMSRPWVIDLLSESLEFQTKIKCLVQTIFDPPRIVLGFAMRNDVPKIEKWLGSSLSRNTSLDVQILHHGNGGPLLKGLASIVQLYSNIPLDKTEQCSSWSDRPLSRAQLNYAGLDAAILPVLVTEWFRQSRNTLI